MKRAALIQELTQMGCVFIRHGGKHDWYQNPRHREIKEYLAHSVIKKLSDLA